VGAPYSPGMTDTVGGGRVELDQEFLPLKMLAHVLTAVLATEIVLAAARLVVPLLARGDSPGQAGTAGTPVVVLSRVGLVATVILFLVWFRRARINAERSSWRQRRARAWAFWGWVIPIADLWIPFQIMGDIWRAGRKPSQRDRIAWLPALWWASWLLTGVLSPIGDSPRSRRTGSWLQLPHSWLSLCVFGIAGVMLIAIIQIVSSSPVGAAEVPPSLATGSLASS
jgi:Domain of unknown function (DUF4328)